MTVPQKRRRTGVQKKLAEVVGFFPPADQEFDHINYEDMRGWVYDGGEVRENGGEVAEEGGEVREDAGEVAEEGGEAEDSENEANFSGVEGGEGGGSDVEVDGGEGVVFNMDRGLVERDVAGVNQGGFGNQGGEIIPVLNFNQDWVFSGAKGTDFNYFTGNSGGTTNIKW